MTERAGVSVIDTLMTCLNNREFVRGYNRLCGTSIGARDDRQGIIRMVDEATGYAAALDEKRDAEMHEFVRFCIDYVWTPVWMQDNAAALDEMGVSHDMRVALARVAMAESAKKKVQP